MEYRQLGSTDLTPSVIGLGGNRIGQEVWSGEGREVEATLLEAVDRGVNFFDTANNYGGGESERVL